jgi:hypothetical protein
MNENSDEIQDNLSDCANSISHAIEELNSLSKRLSELRERQKATFGDWLIRTTVNQPMPTFIQRCKEEDAKEV